VRALGFDFMQRALIACALIGAVAPLVGSFVVQRGQSLIGDGMGHVAFAGAGLAFLVGVSPVGGALALTLVAATALYRLQRGGLSGDLSLALLFYGGIATGFLFAARSGQGLNNVLSLLFGSPLNLSWGDVGVVVVLTTGVLAVVVVLYRPLVAVAFDEPAARVSGVRVDGLVLALTLLVALVVVGGMSTIGLLLISALMVVPVAAAGRLAGSYRGTLLLASAIGAASAVVGLFVAFYGDLTPGAAIVVTVIGCYMAAGVVRRLTRGTAWKGAALALGLIAVTAVPAGAHTRLAAASPAEGTTVDEGLTSVRLEFDGALRAGGDHEIGLFGPGGRRVADQGTREVSDRIVEAVLAEAPASGQHTVQWRIVAADGDTQTGSYGFTYATPLIAPSPTPSATPSRTEAAPSATPSQSELPSGGSSLEEREAADQGGLSAGALIAIAAVPVLGAAAVLLVVRRRGAR